jgi:2-polyprenyl-3-methyl-5-hydroxy-6-metoxy-1,4-benzoquinol methylase
MEFETVKNCPLCDRPSELPTIHGTETKTMISKTGIDKVWYVACECGLHYQSFMMTLESEREYYGKNKYRENLGRPKVDDWSIRYEIDRANRVLEYLDGKISPKKVLDIGCSAGAFLKKIQDKYKCEVMGIEPGDFREYSRSIGLNVLSDIKYLNGNQKFDFITMIHLIEHLTEPIPLLEKVREFMTVDGKLVVVIPELNYRFVHPIAYTEETLERTLNKSGFLVERIGRTRHPDLVMEARRKL